MVISKNISIIIPCRNEKNFIGMCLDSIIANDFPKDSVEVFVVDGISEDGTRDIIMDYAQKYPFIRLLDNPEKVTPVAMNRGIKEANGDYIMVLSSHSKVNNNFIKANVESLEENTADCVGGILITLPANDNLLAQVIAFVLSNPFGVGNSYFRIGFKDPKYVDTVPFGCYKKEVFRKIGLFDEDLVRNQDDEFNFRLNKNGGKVLLTPNIVSYYHARDSLLKLWKMYYQYGYFKPLVAKKLNAVLTWRQLTPACFIGSLITSIILSLIVQQLIWLPFLIMLLYLVTNLAFSFSIALNKGLKYIFLLPVAFATLHFSYGIGYLKGILDFIILNKNKHKKIEDVPLTR